MPTENRSSNTYRHTFTATCPGDGEMIVYTLEIRSLQMIRVEHIKIATSLIKQGWHEQIAANERAAAIEEMWATYWKPEVQTAFQGLGLLYDAGYRKQVTP